MNLKDLASKMLGYSGPPTYQGFTLEETPEEQLEASDGDIKGDIADEKQDRRKYKRPKRTQQADQKEQAQDSWEIQPDLNTNKKRLEALFHLPQNKDVIIREFTMDTGVKVNAFLIFMFNMVDKKLINDHILQPLMLLSDMTPQQVSGLFTCKKVLQNYLPSNNVKELKNYKDVMAEVVAGATVIFFDGCPCALAAETKGFAYRAVEAARTEQVVQGPQEGFTENIRANTSLIRKLLRTENLIAEYLKVGRRNKTSVAVMYMADLANPGLVKEVKRRISGIKADYVPETGVLEEFIEEHPFSLIPQTVKTERPDRVASLLVEGKVAILLDNNPFAMVVPTTFFDLLHSPEDHYVRFPYGFWLRGIRLAAVFLTLLLPAFYVAIATFHQEMIPTDLLLSIAANKERVPFPTIVEMLLMELSFELVREAGVRVPGVIGPTLGIVGTLILGQAAVAASIVSPILIIIVAVTGLASYAIPNYNTSFGFRFMRFIFIYLAATLGFFGVSTGLFILLCLIISMNSFGVPFLSPVAPRMAPSSDLIIRQPGWNQEQRPDYLQALDVRRQPSLSRTWLKMKKTKNKDENPKRR